MGWGIAKIAKIAGITKLKSERQDLTTDEQQVTSG
jgi:hypothetical protein